MSLLSVIKVKLGQAADNARNFLWDASAADGTLKLLRESNGQQIINVLANGEIDFPQMTRSLTGAGYLKLPSGLILQWFTMAPVVTTEVVYNYPIVFPNTFLAWTCGVAGSAGQTVTRSGAITNSSIRLTSNSISQSHFIFVIGY